MTAATRRRWPTKAAIDAAIGALKGAGEEPGGVRINADGSVIILTKGEVRDLDEEAASAKMAEAIRNLAG
ncbi:MAG: hypothetical protein AB7P23_05595 [Amphiplicatus sp.]